MATKYEVMAEALEDRGALGKADEEEPIFVLRAKDLLAAPLVKLWAALAMQNGCDLEKCEEAVRVAEAMEDYTAVHGGKFPD